jgi:hypothetical protein
MADRPQMELDVGAAFECAEAAAWAANELVGRTLETAVTGKEAAATMHHAYSAQFHVGRVLDWSKEDGFDPSKTASLGCGGLVTTLKNFADVFRHRRPVVRRGLRNGQKDGLKIMKKPKAVQRNRWKKLPLRLALLRDSNKLQSPVRHDVQHIGRGVLRVRRG